MSPMQTVALAVAGFLVLNLAAALLRVLRGPSAADRMLAAQLFGTSGVALLLLLAYAQDVPALRDGALIFAVFGVLAAVAFVRRGTGQPPEDDET